MTTERLRSLEWIGRIDGHLRLLDQTKLPGEISYRDIADLEDLRQAIIDLVVRGAPAIGIAAAYGVAQHLGTQLTGAQQSTDIEQALDHAIKRLGSSRPTAVNLMWAMERVRNVFDHHSAMLTAAEMQARLLMEARRIEAEDIRLCDAIAKAGAPLLAEAHKIYTHCNTGSMATAGVGTAIGVIREAHARASGEFSVYAGETRPLLQGARLTALELMHDGIPVTLCCDSAAASLMARGLVDAVVVGADRIAANGDTANKIGTYSLAVLANHHDIPFYVAAPYSTFDLDLTNGDGIVIEERNADEVRQPQGTLFAAADTPVSNPAFDVTPAELITAIITERGVIDQPNPERVAGLMENLYTPPAV